MKSPGVTVRPILNMHDVHHVNEIFLDNVEVPVENLVGEENQGWTYANICSGTSGAASPRSGSTSGSCSASRTSRARNCSRASPLFDDPRFRARIAQLEIRLQALEIMGLRLIWDQEQGQAARPRRVDRQDLQHRPDAGDRRAGDGSGPARMLSRTSPKRNTSASTASSPARHTRTGLAATHFDNHKYSIFAGSNEIQRNIIAKMILGL